MSMSLRSHLVTGVAAVATTALVASPTTVSAHPSIQSDERAVAAGVNLAASVKPMVLEPLRPEQVATARAAISRIDPESTFAAAAVAAPLNAASDWVNEAYQWLQYWADYGVELADYVLQFVPFGYFIGDQITIFYDFLVTPIADSVVYGLIDPVLNDPLNLSTWINGLVNVGQTAITAAVNTAIVEFNYFFGWLIPPLPPLPIPPLPIAVQTVEPLQTVLETVEDASPMAAARVSVDEGVVDEGVVDEGVDAGEVEGSTEKSADALSTDTTTDDATETDVAPETDDATETDVAPETDDATEVTPNKSTSGTVSAQGEVRSSVTSAPVEDTQPGAAPASDNDKSANVDPTDTTTTSGTTTTGTTTSADDTTSTKKSDAADD